MSEPEGLVTVCNKCSTPKPDEALHGDECGCEEGSLFNQIEDALALEVRRLQAKLDARSSAGKNFEVNIGDQAGPAEDGVGSLAEHSEATA